MLRNFFHVLLSPMLMCFHILQSSTLSMASPLKICLPLHLWTTWCNVIPLPSLFALFWPISPPGLLLTQTDNLFRKTLILALLPHKLSSTSKSPHLQKHFHQLKLKSHHPHLQSHIPRATSLQSIQNLERANLQSAKWNLKLLQANWELQKPKNSNVELLRLPKLIQTCVSFGGNIMN
jgi:hypothetical protein